MAVIFRLRCFAVTGFSHWSAERSRPYL